jgi:hypothetical protein
MYYKNIADYEALVAHKNHRKKRTETVVPESNQHNPVKRNIKYFQKITQVLLKVTGAKSIQSNT